MQRLLNALSQSVNTALMSVGEVSQVVGSHLAVSCSQSLCDPPNPPMSWGEQEVETGFSP
jgi:hypothetical protein